MSKNTEDWCSRVIRGTLPTDAPSAEALVGRRDAPLMWYRVVETGASTECPPRIAEALRRAASARAVEAQVMNRELARVLDAAGREGIRMVLLKGAAIAHTHYPLAHLRPRGDSDLLVHVDDRERLAAVLTSCGYSRSGAVDGSLVTSQQQWRRVLGRGLDHTLDVHWAVFNPHAFAEVLIPAELFERSVPVPALGPAARAPHPVHALLLACVHRVAHHAGDEDLLWLYDIRLLAASLSEEDAEEFVALAMARGVAAVCSDSLEAARRAVGGRFPRAVESWLAAAPWRDVHEPTAEFLTPHRQVDQLVSDLRALPDLGARARLVRQHLFPRADYMLRRYGVRSRLLLPFLYLRRLVEGLPRWFRR